MQIQVKQAEIVEALKLYLKSKGLDLTGKKFTADFTMVRKPISSVMAEVTIEDDVLVIPGVTDIPLTPEEEEDQPTAKPTPVSLVINNPAPVETSTDSLEEDPQPQEEAAPVAESKPTNSLFSTGQ